MSPKVNPCWRLLVYIIAVMSLALCSLNHDLKCTYFCILRAKNKGTIISTLSKKTWTDFVTFR